MDVKHKIEELMPVINEVRNDAHTLHASVNHAYDRIRPYGFHLDMVVNWVRKYIDEVCDCVATFHPVDGEPSFGEWMKQIKDDSMR